MAAPVARLRAFFLPALIALAACSSNSPPGGGGVGPGTDGGTDGGTVPFACTTCASGLCLPAGGCAECVDSSKCAAPRARCDTTTWTCVACLVKADCAAGQYCGADHACAAGACGIGADCTSGWCLPSHDCEDCAGDGECSPGKRCGTGLCSAPCVDTCPTPGQTCCSGRCVDLRRDIAHCGSCQTACAANQFCTGEACATTSFENVCANPRVTVVQDLQGYDRDAGVSVGEALAACGPPPGSQLRYLDQDDPDAGIFDTESGRLTTRGGETLVATGGPVVQKITKYLETEGLVPVHFEGETWSRAFVGPDGGVLASADVQDGGVSARHDYFLLQLGRDPFNGSFSLSAYGFGGPGTQAAAWYFVNVVLPTRPGRADRWYVVEWTDLDGNGVPDGAGEFTVKASGN